MTFPYKKVLIIGATSGIGEALAVKMLQNGVKVIAAGRRKENLDKFVREHGADKVSAVTVDITELEKLPSFAKS
jgi:NADP-dependent 3-hydroxy acid dehydrogenase YdfG